MPAAWRSTEATDGVVRESAGVFAQPHTSALARAASVVATMIALSAILLAPFPFGATAVPAVASLIAALCCALAIGIFGTPIHLRPLMLAPLALVGGAGGLAYLQEVGNPLLGPPAAIWGDTARLLGDAPTARLALSAGRTLPALGGPLLAATAFACGVVAGRSRRLASRAVALIALGGALYALAALAWYAVMPDYVLWWRKSQHVDDLTATFTNRNTAAVFLGFILIANASRIASSIARTSSRQALRSGRVMTAARRRLLINAGLAMPCLVAILLTNSRAGTILSIAAACMAAFLRLAGRGGSRSRLETTIIVALLGTPVAIILFFQTRLSETFSDGGRIAAYRATLAMIGDHPWLGVGLGSFASAFPAWRLPDAPMWGVWDRAHNTLLEIAAEAGLPAATLIGIFWLGVLILLLRSALRRPDSSTVTAFAATLLGATHSLVDFSVQVAGCGALFYFLAGMGVARSVDKRHRRKSASEPPRSVIARPRNLENVTS